MLEISIKASGETVEEVCLELKKMLEALVQSNGTEQTDMICDNEKVRALCEQENVVGWRNLSIKNIGLTAGICASLAGVGIRTIGQLVEYGIGNLTRIPRIGPASARTVKESLDSLGIDLSRLR